MTRNVCVRIVIVALMLGVVSVGFAQYRRRGRRSFDLGDRNGVPRWNVNEQFKQDTFTFVRVRYHSKGYGPGWATDFPDSDLNFSLRLQQLTSIKVNPDPIILELTDEKIFDYSVLVHDRAR